MAYQPLGQVAVDYCAIVIYGLYHSICIFFFFFFEAGRAQTKTIQFAMDFSLSVFPPLLSTPWYTISNKSQSFVFLSPSFLCCSSDTAVLAWSQRTGGGRRKRRAMASVSTWTLGWGIERASVQTNQWPSRPRVCRGGNSLFLLFHGFCVALMNSWQREQHFMSSFISLCIFFK